MDRRTLVKGTFGAAGAVLLGVATPLEAQAAVASGLKTGSTGSRVVTLQRRLNQLGYWCGSSDGSFGSMTHHAVIAFQKAAGLSRDGVVGPITSSRLNKGYRPAARYNGGDTHFEVDKRRQILLTVVNGSVREVASTSTGSGERYYNRGWHTASTPTGSFRIYSRYSSGWQEGPLGALYRPTYFNGGIALHGSNSVPVYPASHGCCRLTPVYMNRLWSLGRVPVGRRVYVY